MVFLIPVIDLVVAPILLDLVLEIDTLRTNRASVLPSIPFRCLSISFVFRCILVARDIALAFLWL